MPRLLIVTLAIVATYACSKEPKKDSENGSEGAQKTQNVLSASDLSTPDIVALEPTFIVKDLEREESLFEYARSKEELDNVQASCFDGWRQKQRFEAGQGYLRLNTVRDQDFVACVMSEFANSIQASGGTVTPSDQSQSPADECAVSTNDYGSVMVSGEGWSRSELRANHDFSRFNGKSIADPDIEQGLLRQELQKEVAGSLHDATQSRNLMDGEICHSRQYSRYTLLQASSSECTSELLADGISKKNCWYKYAQRIVSIDAGPIDMQTLRSDQTDSNHYVEATSIDVMRRQGAAFPYSGKKTVRYRNWTGEIIFGEGNPTYRLTNGTETVEGTFPTPTE